jgi:hypothetical protein
MTSKESSVAKLTELQQPPTPKHRRSPKEQALAPLIKRRDALKHRWDEADAAALRRHKAKFGPEHDDLCRMISAIEAAREGE